MNSQSRSTSSGCTQSALKNKLYLIVCYVRVCVCVSLLRIRNARIYGCICTYNRLLDNCHFVSLAIFYVDWLRRQVQLQVEQGRRRTKARQLIYGIAINYCRTLSAWAAEGGRGGERHERLPGEGIIIEPHGVCVTRHESRLTNVRTQAKIAVEGGSWEVRGERKATVVVRAASIFWQLARIMLIYFIRRQFKVYKQQFATRGGGKRELKKKRLKENGSVSYKKAKHFIANFCKATKQVLLLN